ncbi:uncharacterized protein DS421_4g118200 [Arachis hypogaea]|nr:uncharacterized protein DS421_4g118200 [Arachis hypogaea]
MSMESPCCAPTEPQLLGGLEGWWSAYLSSTNHVPRPSTVGQQPLLQRHPAVDLVQPIR